MDEFLLGLFIAVKSLVYVGGWIAPDKVPPRIADMQVAVTLKDVKVSCSVVNAYPQEMKRLALSGTPVLLYVFTEARQVEKDSLVATVAAENRIEYDLVDKRCRLVRSASGDTLIFSSLDSALTASTAFGRVAVLSKMQIRADRSYYFIMWAVLGKTRVEALGNREIDLMYFWNYKRPTLRTDPFKGEQFLAFPK
jgi:hypothetical protein